MKDFFGKNEFVYFDGAMGSLLIAAGKKPNECGEAMNIENPDAIENIHKMYVDAGSMIICTNTFGANHDKLKKTPYSVDGVVSAAVQIAKEAANGRAKVALDIGPVGQLLEPYGDLEENEAYDMFRVQAECGEKAGADIAAIETMTAIEEAEIAMKAVRENTKLPVFVTMSFDENGYTMMGVTVEALCSLAEKYNAAAVGMNCSHAPEDMLPVAEWFVKAAKMPVIIKLNAGKPNSDGSYSVGPEEFARQMLPYKALGVKIVGGCCGTTPEHIRKLKAAFDR